MSSPLETPEPNFGHLISMTDERGTFEHALFSEPRPEHGYCTDDMARVLVVASPGAGAARRRCATWRCSACDFFRTRWTRRASVEIG